MVESASKKKVVIIGAGIGGLSAADHLRKDGRFDIQILEARNRVGGRLYAEKMGNNDYKVDLGGTWIHGAGPGLFNHNDKHPIDYPRELNPIYTYCLEKKIPITFAFADKYETEDRYYWDKKSKGEIPFDIEDTLEEMGDFFDDVQSRKISLDKSVYDIMKPWLEKKCKNEEDRVFYHTAMNVWFSQDYGGDFRYLSAAMIKADDEFKGAEYVFPKNGY